ncbi:MAG: nuclear transport factor 2 family protein [Proteobacteria bacterium]|nr:nuclear transport factor 2 family protein [Pseudomonadota bacterium]
MRRFAFPLALLALAACTPRAPDRAADRKEIMDGEQAWGQAFVTGDAAAIERLLAPDFQGVDPSGKVYAKSDMLREVNATAHSTSDTLGNVMIRFYGDTAIAQGTEHEVGPAPGKEERDSIWTDVWVKKDGHWRIEAAEDLTPDPNAGG